MHMADIRRSGMGGFFRSLWMLCGVVMGGLWCRPTRRPVNRSELVHRHATLGIQR